MASMIAVVSSNSQHSLVLQRQIVGVASPSYTPLSQDRDVFGALDSSDVFESSGNKIDSNPPSTDGFASSPTG